MAILYLLTGYEGNIWIFGPEGRRPRTTFSLIMPSQQLFCYTLINVLLYNY